MKERIKELQAIVDSARDFAEVTQDAVDNLNQALYVASQQNVRAGQKLVILQAELNAMKEAL